MQASFNESLTPLTELLKDFQDLFEIKCIPKKPDDIPANPWGTYKHTGWQGIGDWLGTGAIRRVKSYRSFLKARAFARGLELSSWAEWLSYCRGKKMKGTPPKPVDIPLTPNMVYKNKGWEGMIDWLDKNKHCKRKRRSL